MRILALAYYYPPNSSSGTFRSLYFLNHIVRGGDEVTVITASTQDYDAISSIDPALATQIDPRVAVVRTRVGRPVDALVRLRNRLLRRRSDGVGRAPPGPAGGRTGPPRDALQGAKDFITDLLAFPDANVGWLPSTYAAAMRTVRAWRPDCVYSSGTPWTSHVVAVLVKIRCGVPIVLDFRDPWVVNPGLAHRRAWFRRMSASTESWCVRHADHVLCNTDPLRDSFIERYPREDRSKFSTLTNGYEGLAAVPPAAANSRFTIVHVGEIYHSRNPASFFEALRRLIASGRVARDRLLVQLVGGLESNSEVDALLTSPELLGVAQLIGRVPHERALEYQRQADALVLFQMGYPLQVPRKLYEYMSMTKPILAITEPTGATASLVRDFEFGVVAEPGAEAIADAIVGLHADWVRNDRSTRRISAAGRYENARLARDLRERLAAVSSCSASQRCTAKPPAESILPDKDKAEPE